MKYYETKIGKIIEQEFDTRVENAVAISWIRELNVLNGLQMKILPVLKEMDYVPQHSIRIL